MPTYVKSPTVDSVEKGAEKEVKGLENQANNTLQNMVDDDGQLHGYIWPIAS